MPDTLSLSAGVSFGLLAGIVSGVCYLVANGVTWQRSGDSGRRRCLASSPSEGVCGTCGGDKQGGLIPCICLHHQPAKFESGAWFLRQVQRAVSLMPWSISTDKLEQIDEECESPDGAQAGGELRNVREFLEALSAKLAGGTLERTRATPLNNHPAYLLPARGAVSGPSEQQGGASGAHAHLKRLVARVVEEATALPALARYAAEPTRETSVDSTTYEDLLATAILNKVIERYQTENGSGGRSSGIHSASASPTPSERSSPRSLHSRHTRDATPPLREEEDVSDWEEGEATDDALDLPRRVPFPEFGGDIIHHIDNAERDFDEVSGSDIQAVDGSWEENWLFQKKKIKSQSVPVPMLVPNSNADYRALIGDRDADDTTDLSDNGSDAEEEIADYKSDIQKVLESKHIIGGRTVIEEYDFEPDSLTVLEVLNDNKNLDKIKGTKEKDVVDAINKEVNENKSEKTTDDFKTEFLNNSNVLILGVNSGPVEKAEFALNEEIYRTNINGNFDDFTKEENLQTNGEVYKDIMDSLVNEKGSTNTLASRHEREGEYEETVTKPVQRYADSLRRKHFDDTQEIPTRDTDQSDDLIPGTIAYRERKKWLNAVDMPNNPYSPEAIEKRLTAKRTSSLFDLLTSSSQDLEVHTRSEDVVDNKVTSDEEQVPVKEEKNHTVQTLTVHTETIYNGTRSKSPSPKILKDVLAEEVPQYKRYGRDYYIREARSSSGGRRMGSSSSLSSVSPRSLSTERDPSSTDTPAAVSPLSSLEAAALHASLPRAALSPRHASANFAINPIFENPDRQCDRDDPPPDANGLLIHQFNNIAANQHYTKFNNSEDSTQSFTTKPSDKSPILIDYEDINEASLFEAKPIVVDDESDKKIAEILQTVADISEPMKSPNPSIDESYISSSSLEDTIKIYNVQTGEIMKCQPEDKVSVRYNEPTDTNENIDMPDKNISNCSQDNTSQDAGDVEDTSVIIVEDDLEEEKLDIVSDLVEILPQLPKVKELAKIFVTMDNTNESPQPQPDVLKRRKSIENILNAEIKSEKSGNKLQYMHSLTARSISREFREELKLSMATPLKVPGGDKDIPEGIEEITKESSRPNSPVPEPGTIKTKLAFFESLRSKFSK